MNIHVTANEAGRNVYYLRKLESALRLLIDAIKNNEVNKSEIIQCLLIIIKFSIKTLKIRPTI